MIIGDRRHRIFFQTPTRTADGAGGTTDTWGPVTAATGEVLNDGTAESGNADWAAVTPATALQIERLLGGRLEAPVHYLLTVRDRHDVTAAARVRWPRAEGWKTLVIRATSLRFRGGATDLILACEEVPA